MNPVEKTVSRTRVVYTGWRSAPSPDGAETASPAVPSHPLRLIRMIVGPLSPDCRARETRYPVPVIAPHPLPRHCERSEATQSPRSDGGDAAPWRSEEHTSELQSLMRISYAVFC